MSTKYVLFYDTAPGGMEKAAENFPAHSARGQAFHEHGTLVAYGPFANAAEDGSMAVFSSRETAEEFLQGDPFVLNGVVGRWRILEWNEAFLP